MPDDERWLRHTFHLAQRAVELGDFAFGSVLVSAADELLIEGLQLVETTGDWLAHAEMNVLREAASRWTRSELSGCTLYSSTEPCPMCTGAIGWSVNRLVFGLSQVRMYVLWPGRPRFVEPWNCRLLLGRVEPPMQVIGPMLEDEAAAAHLLAAERCSTSATDDNE